MFPVVGRFLKFGNVSYDTAGRLVLLVILLVGADANKGSS
jgi:hypothetical protein